MKLQINKEWLRRMAEKEGNGILSVGGLVCQINQENHEKLALTPKKHTGQASERHALAHLVELQRRKLRFSLEVLAKKADVELEDLLSLENGHDSPEPRTVFKIANALKLPNDKLMHLAGLVMERNSHLEQAAVRFAARSASIETLSPEESDALDEFVRILSE